MNYDAGLREQSEVIHDDEYVHLRVEWKKPKDHRHKFEPVAEGPYKVTKGDNNTVFIEKMERFVENVSRSRVLLTPRPETRNEVEDILKPIAINENDSKYPTGEDVKSKT